MILKKISCKMGVKSYIVGGYIRDEILNLESNDIDITVEGDGIRYALMLSKILNGKIEIHEKFKTAKIQADKYTFDVVSARKEYYAHSGILPDVELADIVEDIKRRDFTINMLAFDIKEGMIIDLCNGLDDIKNKLIRVVHDKSFNDDPTRIFRALRYSVRLDFKLEEHTELLLKQSIANGDIDNLSADRIMNEIYLILSEKNPETIVKLMKYYEIDKKIFKGIDINIKNLNTYARYGDVLLYRFLLFFYNVKKDDLDYLNEKFNFRRQYSKGLSDLIEIKMNLYTLKDDIAVYNLFKDKKIEAINAIYTMEGENIKKIVDRYFEVIRSLKLEVNGDAIKELGLEPSPVYKKILEKIYYDKLCGKIINKEDEFERLKQYVEKVKRGEKI
ncbi:CCA tRNA nucleotidyltransferase [Thermoanaerobacterium butyriciformans]|uniref:Poly(A) polymerase/tRNA nucleotidyltransferase (CCA-adding enzyme) n=1 Tax=Thermoanaerobacterium butyriciformans TaxID=1702242 RepID=A0ABS4NFA9_9THEO|nr:CCA tRNA nucleotidyltransferase [Thermoanaerobacterium butyriciformans]MBP2071710.1 poly(A) polymerase/tRNA nucleotidyltransferase (CCA-adding enzyme) [Thermoanaerobacterium butyriciformans]